MSKFVVQVINNATSTYVVEAENENEAKEAIWVGKYSERNDSTYNKTNVYNAPDAVTLAAPSVQVEDTTPPTLEAVAA